MGRVTRNDVARLAGTSTAVVSYVMNDGPRPVAATTRERVLAAAAQLGYQPSQLARGLRLGRASLLAVLVPDATRPYFAQLAHAVEQAAAADGHLTLMASSGDAATQRRYLESFLSLGVAGIVLADTGSAPGVASLLQAGPTPVVSLHRRSRGMPGPAVLADDRHGGLLVAEHLLGHGYRRLGCLSGLGVRQPVSDRERGFITRVVAAGRSTPDIVRAPYSPNEARDAAISLLTRRQPPRAVFATTDELALALVETARELGLRVPEDVAVVGMDGLPASAPRLTSVEVPFTEMARRAVTAVLDDEERSGLTRLPVRLRTGTTCGCR